MYTLSRLRLNIQPQRCRGIQHKCWFLLFCQVWNHPVVRTSSADSNVILKARWTWRNNGDFFFFPFFKFQNIIPYQSGVLRLVIIQAFQFFFYIFKSFAKRVKLKNKVNGSFSYVMSFERMGRQTESNIFLTCLLTFISPNSNLTTACISTGTRT